MSAPYQETTTTNWFQRMGGAIKGFFIGILLFLIAFPLLFSNEGAEVKRIRGLNEGSGMVVSVGADSVLEDHEGKLVHVSGTATTNDVLTDSTFGLSVVGVRLSRSVEMYQWIENVKSETKEKLGGGTETVKTYTYSKNWSSSLVNSGAFKDPAAPRNPASMPYDDLTMSAQNVALGAFALNPSQISRVGQSQKITGAELAKLPVAANGSLSVFGDYLYKGFPADPQIGDVRISFTVTKPGAVTVVAKQTGTTFAPFKTKSTTIDLLKNATLSADEMFEAAKTERKILSWIIRIVGLLMMVIGLNMVLKPISTTFAVIPLLGKISGGVLGVVAFLLGFGFAFVTISISWVFFRPLIGVPLLLVGVAALVLPKFLVKKQETAQAA